MKKKIGLRGDDYDMRERSEFNRQIQEVEHASLTERKEGFTEYLDDLKNNPALVAERIGWLLNGSYGKGSYDVARQIVSSPRMNQTAALGVIIAALEWHCPNVFARKAYNSLTSAQQEKLNSLIKEEITYHKSNLQGGRMHFFNMRKIPKRLKKGSSQAKRAMSKLRALRSKGKRIAKKAKIKPFFFSKERTPKRRTSVRRVRENLEPIIIKEGSMAGRKSRKSRKSSRKVSRRSRRAYRGEFGRRKRRSGRRFHGAIGGFKPLETVMEVAGIGAGAVGASFVAKLVPVADMRIKALVPIALGVILPMLKFGKSAIMRNVATGSLAIGTIALIKAFAPQIPLLSGAQSAEEVIKAIEGMPEEEQALLGVTIQTSGEEVLQGSDTQDAPLSPADAM